MCWGGGGEECECGMSPVSGVDVSVNVSGGLEAGAFALHARSGAWRG